VAKAEFDAVRCYFDRGDSGEFDAGRCYFDRGDSGEFDAGRCYFDRGEGREFDATSTVAATSGLLRGLGVHALPTFGEA